MSREQQDLQFFADGNLKIINRAINMVKKINRSTALI